MNNGNKSMMRAVGVAVAMMIGVSSVRAADDGKQPADMNKPVKVFILLGQSNMLGFGKIAGGEGSLENAVKVNKLYPYLVDEAGNWTVRNDVRYVRVMNEQEFNNEFMTIKGNIGPEIGIGHFVGNVLDAPVMILKSCIGNRSLGWDLLPPGTPRYSHEGQECPGYMETVKSKGDSTIVPYVKGGDCLQWYAGLQYDSDVAAAKRVLADLDKYYPGAKACEVAGFFFWQGDKDRYNAAHAANYEKNLVRLYEALKKDFEAPDAKFVVATLGQTPKGAEGNDGKILEAQLAVDGDSGKYPQHKGKVKTFYSNPVSKGGASNGHYNGNAETYMNVGEGMGQAMAELLKE